MALTKTQVSELYVSLFGRASEGDGNTAWQSWADAATAATDMLATPAAATYFGSSLDSDRAFVEHIYLNTLNKTPADDEAGIAAWTAKLTEGEWTRGEMVAKLIATINLYAPGGDLYDSADAVTQAAYNQFANRVEVSNYTADTLAAAPADYATSLAFGEDLTVTDDAATVTAAKADVDAAVPAPSVPGDTFKLTSGTDDFTGTANDDSFDAPIVQNPWAGGVSNSLSSADMLKGAGGYDTLHAELVPEFFGATGDNQIDVQPRTSGIEEVTFEARDSGSNDINGNVLVTVDAKNMTGVEKIGSYYSDGDLVIENLTTLADNGTKRNTSDMTITMDHTDNTNTDTDASDLHVYFDDNYLISGTESLYTLELRIVNAFQLAEDNEPLVGFLAASFNVDSELVTVDISSATTYAEVASLINAELAAQGITTVTATLMADRTAIFTDDIGSYSQGDVAGSYTPILLSSNTEELSAGPIQLDSDVEDFDGLNTWTNPTSETTNEPVSINVELTKVGRGGEGGDLLIGAKSNAQGIPVMDVTVMGDESLPNNLGTLGTTASDLERVTISSEAGRTTADIAENGYASLTIRDGFGQLSLDTVNANAFFGDLSLGTNTAVTNISNLLAAGGGDVTVVQEIFAGANIGAGDEFDSDDTNAYIVTTGAGEDTITVDATDGAQLTVTSGAGDDTITVSIDGTDDSGSDETFATINSSGGDNTVTVISSDPTHDATITLGGGADTVNGNTVNITASTGAGNDVIYTNNTGNKAVAGLAAAASAVLADANNAASYSVGTKAELLYGRTVQVTLDLPEAGGSANTANPFTDGLEVTADIDASNGYLTTETDLYNAIADAINNDAVTNKLAVASVDSLGNLVVTYKIDGITLTDDIVHVEILGDWADLSTTEQNAIVAQLQSDYNDSDITAADVEAEYDEVNAITDALATTSEGSDSVDGDSNIVNGGTGDDVIVLSSEDGVSDTVVFDTTAIGNDTIVHFTVGAGEDILDFSAWLDNVSSSSGSTVSEVRIDGTTAAIGAMIENSVAVTTQATFNNDDATAAAGAQNVEDMTEAEMLAEMNAAQFASSSNDANFVGTVVKSILMVEDSGSLVAADDNEGFYYVYEVEYTEGATNAFTSVDLIGTVDFGSTLGALDDTNIA